MLDHPHHARKDSLRQFRIVAPDTTNLFIDPFLRLFNLYGCEYPRRPGTARLGPGIIEINT